LAHLVNEYTSRADSEVEVNCGTAKQYLKFHWMSNGSCDNIAAVPNTGSIHEQGEIRAIKIQF